MFAENVENSRSARCRQSWLMMSAAFEIGRPSLLVPRSGLFELQANSIAKELRPAVRSDYVIDTPEILRREVQVQTREVERRASHRGRLAPHG